MKRTVLALLLVGSSCAVFAQEDSAKVNSNMTTPTNGNTMTTNTEYNAYSAFTAIPPAHVNVYLQRDYPTATSVRWRQMEDWWHGFYLENGQPMHVYYNNAGNTFRVAIPVRQSLIPDEVVTKAVDMYGPTIYDVTSVKDANGQDVYHVRVIENGTVSSQWIDANGNKVIDVFRVEDTDPMNASNQLNTQSDNAAMDQNTEIKIKTETKDGKETKTKIENGKVKTKKDE